MGNGVSGKPQQARNFTRRNEGFTCRKCGAGVPAAGRTCRNHCPVCLHSLHVDHMPGDRANPCRGLMKPVGYENHSKKGLMLHFQCLACGARTRNIALTDDPDCPDDYERILALSGIGLT